MTRIQTIASSLLVLSLAVPAAAAAQRRGGGESDGGSAGGRTSSEPSVGTAQPRSAPSAPAPAPSSSGSPSRPSSVRGSSPASAPSGNSGSSVRSGANRGAGGRAEAQSRLRNDRVVRGTAQPRTGPVPRGGSDDRYFSYGYPWYSNGSHVGYLGLYSPFYYGRSGWGWGGYGYSYWHDPFLYDPYSYYGGPWPYYWGGSGTGSRSDRSDEGEPMGSLRLKVNPRLAKVYVDGALAGVVDEFDGLTNHLRLPVGRHQIEFRADGYETTSLEVTVERGKTRTERVNLKQR